MKVEVLPSSLSGTVSAPGSKSVAQRMVACALLSKGESVLLDYPDSLDCQTALNVAQALGAVVTVRSGAAHIKGGFPQAFHSGIRNPREVLHCGESGLSSRMFTPIASLSEKLIRIEGEGTLLRRPFNDFESVLPALGVQCATNGGYLPLSVQGPLQHGEVNVNASMSSQFLTGLLIALPRAGGESVIHVQELKSKPYIQLTLQVMNEFGVDVIHHDLKEFRITPGQYQPQTLKVPGDWSGAACLLVAGALCSEEGIRISNLSTRSEQADRAIIQVLRDAGAEVLEEGDTIYVKANEVKAFDFDANDCPDLIPALVALAAFADGVSTIGGIRRLIHKESNRGKVLQQEFAKANIRIVLRDDEMKIYPASVRRAVINSHNDHRIAMAAAVLGLAGDRMTIRGAECVSKSFPGYFDAIQALGGKVQVHATTL